MTEAVSARFPQAPAALGAGHGASRSALSAVDWAFFAAIILATTTPDYWKDDFGPQVVVAIVAACCAYAAYGYLYLGIVFRNRLLAAWSCLGALYAFLSWARWLPGTPVVFLQEYILRMGYFVFLVYPATAAFYLFFIKARNAGKLRSVAWICVGSSVGAMLAYHYFPVYDGWWRVDDGDATFAGDVLAVLDYGLHNIATLFWWGALLLAIKRPTWMLCALGFMLVSQSSQMRILAVMVALMWLWPKPQRLVLPLSLVVIFGFPIAGAMVVWFANNLAHGPDMVSRARWWMDSLTALAQNYGFGYGFGADSVVDATAEDRFLVIGKWAKLPVMVIHNSFVYVFYSMGIIGGSLLVAFYVMDVLPRKSGAREVDRHSGMVFLMACLTTSVNVVLESPNYVIGVCWIFAYLLEMNDRIAGRISQKRA